MQNPRLATRYAKSLLDLAVERDSVESSLKDMHLLNSICSQSRDFAIMLRSPIISGDKKLSVINLALKNYGVSDLTYTFISLLVTKGRELNLPEIAEAFIAQYNELKNIRTVNLTTAVVMDAGIKKSIETKISGYMPNDTIDLKVNTDESLIGGFVLEVENRLYDASIKKSLSDIRSKIIDSSYVSKI
jgi:F-type H+-transporting ATPase subunit delta